MSLLKQVVIGKRISCWAPGDRSLLAVGNGLRTWLLWVQLPTLWENIHSHPQQVRSTVPSFPVLLTETLGYHCAANRLRVCSQMTSPLYRTQSTHPAPSASGLWTAFSCQARWHSRQNSRPLADVEVFKILFQRLWLEGVVSSELLRHRTSDHGMNVWPECGFDTLRCLCLLSLASDSTRSNGACEFLLILPW